MNDKLASLTHDRTTPTPFSSGFFGGVFDHIDRRHGDNLYPAGELCQHRARQGGIRCGIRRRSAVLRSVFHPDGI